MPAPDIQHIGDAGADAVHSSSDEESVHDEEGGGNRFQIFMDLHFFCMLLPQGCSGELGCVEFQHSAQDSAFRRGGALSPQGHQQPRGDEGLVP